MLKLLTTGALALAMTGFALGAAAPAQAAMPLHGGATIELAAMHHHRHRVCHTEWHHHHPVQVCYWRWTRW